MIDINFPKFDLGYGRVSVGYYNIDTGCNELREVRALLLYGYLYNVYCMYSNLVIKC